MKFLSTIICLAFVLPLYAETVMPADQAAQFFEPVLGGDVNAPIRLRCFLKTEGSLGSAVLLDFSQPVGPMSVKDLSHFASFSATAKGLFDQMDPLLSQGRLEVRFVESGFLFETFGVSAKAATVAKNRPNSEVKIDTILVEDDLRSPIEQLSILAHEFQHVLDREWENEDLARAKNDEAGAQRFVLRSELNGYMTEAKVQSEIYAASHCNRAAGFEHEVDYPTADLMIVNYRLHHLYNEIVDDEMRETMLGLDELSKQDRESGIEKMKI